MTFLQKVKSILTSVRFWLVTLTAATTLLQAHVDGGLTTEIVLTTVKMWFGVVAGLGTLDSVATKFGTAFSAKK